MTLSLNRPPLSTKPANIFIYWLIAFFSLLPSAGWSAIDVHTFDNRQQEQQYQTLIAEFRCPKCQNQNLASSDAGIAKDLKNKTYQMVKAGKSNDEIRHFMVERYGHFISYKPPVQPSTYLLWYFPPAVLLILFGLWWYHNRKLKPVDTIQGNKITGKPTNTKNSNSKNNSSSKNSNNSRHRGDTDHPLNRSSDIANQSTVHHNKNCQHKSLSLILIFTLFVSGLLYLNMSHYLLVIDLWQSDTPSDTQQSNTKQEQEGDNITQVADKLLTAQINTPPQWILNSPTHLDKLIDKMKLNVHQHPDDSQRWMRLGQVLWQIQKPESALIAIERANRLAPNEADIAIKYAQIDLLLNNNILSTKAEKSLKYLLYTNNQNNQTAILLLIMSHIRQGNSTEALAYVEQLKADIANRQGNHTFAMQQLDSLTEVIHNASTTPNDNLKQSLQKPKTH